MLGGKQACAAHDVQRLFRLWGAFSVLRVRLVLRVSDPCDIGFRDKDGMRGQ